MDKDDYENQGYTFNSDYIFRDKIAQNATPAFVIDNPGWAPDFSYCRGFGGNQQFYSTARRNGKDTRQMKQGSTNWETEYDQETNEDWRFGSTGKSMTTSTASLHKVDTIIQVVLEIIIVERCGESFQSLSQVQRGKELVLHKLMIMDLEQLPKWLLLAL